MRGKGMKGNIKARSRKLRRESTDAERLLWRHLRNRHLSGYKFRRQAVIEDYIIDFLCPETGLIVEVDGGQHIDQKNYDEERTNKLESMGFTVQRFWNNEVLNQTRDVLEQIYQHLSIYPSPRPSPKVRGNDK